MKIMAIFEGTQETIDQLGDDDSCLCAVEVTETFLEDLQVENFLKECPKCKGDAWLRSDGIECTGCSLELQTYNFSGTPELQMKQAIIEWNKRS